MKLDIDPRSPIKARSYQTVKIGPTAFLLSTQYLGLLLLVAVGLLETIIFWLILVFSGVSHNC